MYARHAVHSVRRARPRGLQPWEGGTGMRGQVKQRRYIEYLDQLGSGTLYTLLLLLSTRTMRASVPAANGSRGGGCISYGPSRVTCVAGRWHARSLVSHHLYSAPNATARAAHAANPILPAPPSLFAVCSGAARAAAAAAMHSAAMFINPRGKMQKVVCVAVRCVPTWGARPAQALCRLGLGPCRRPQGSPPGVSCRVCSVHAHGPGRAG